MCGTGPVCSPNGLSLRANMSVDQFVRSLAASAQRLAAGFVSTTESEFVWLKELEAQLGASMDDVEPAT